MCMTTSLNDSLPPCCDLPLRKKVKCLKRKVQFNTAVTEQQADEIHSLDDVQKETLWYSRSEMQDIRKQVKRILRKEIDLQTSDDECVRGLEMSGDRRRSRQVAAKIGMILELQEENWHTGVALNTGLSALSQSLSRVDVRASVKQAERDFVEVY